MCWNYVSWVKLDIYIAYKYTCVLEHAFKILMWLHVYRGMYTPSVSKHSKRITFGQAQPRVTGRLPDCEGMSTSTQRHSSGSGAGMEQGTTDGAENKWAEGWDWSGGAVRANCTAQESTYHSKGNLAVPGALPDPDWRLGLFRPYDTVSCLDLFQWVFLNQEISQENTTCWLHSLEKSKFWPYSPPATSRRSRPPGSLQSPPR